MSDQDKISELSKSNARMFDTIVSMGEQITHFQVLLELKEKERIEWADMCIKKQARIEQLERMLK